MDSTTLLFGLRPNGPGPDEPKPIAEPTPERPAFGQRCLLRKNGLPYASVTEEGLVRLVPDHQGHETVLGTITIDGRVKNRFGEAIGHWSAQDGLSSLTGTAEAHSGTIASGQGQQLIFLTADGDVIRGVRPLSYQVCPPRIYGAAAVLLCDDEL